MKHLDALRAYTQVRANGWEHGAAVKTARMVFSAGGFRGLGGLFGGGNATGWPNIFSKLTDPRPVRAGGRDGGSLEAFWRNSTVQACLWWIQRNYPEARLRVLDGTGDDAEEVKDHPLTHLVNAPNPAYGPDQLWMRTLCDLWIFGRGNAYWEKIRDATGTPVQLWHVPATEIEPDWIKSGSEFISFYRRNVNGQVTLVPPADIVHFRLGYDPHNQRKGFSPLLAGESESAVLNEGALFRLDLMQRHGVPGYGLVPQEEASDLTPEQAKQIEALWMEKHTGQDRFGLFIPNFKSKLERVGFSPQELDIREMLEWDADVICALFGLSSMVLGLPSGDKHRTFANMGEARESAVESNIVPTQDSAAADVERQLLPDFETGPRLLRRRHMGWDRSQVRVLQEDRDKLWTRLDLAVKSGWITPDEARKIAGMKPLPDGAGAKPISPQAGVAGMPGIDPNAPESSGDRAAQGGAAPNGFRPLTGEDLAGKRLHVALKAADGKQEFITVHGRVIPLTDATSGGDGGSGTAPAAPRPGFRNATEADRKRIGLGGTFTTAHVNEDETGDLQAIGWRANGTDKYFYSAAHQERQKAAKFERIRQFHHELPGLVNSIESELDSGGKRAAEAGVLYLQKTMAFRVGGDGSSQVKDPETGETSAVDTFGASNLTRSHVAIKDGVAIFDFVGKSGVRQQHSSDDPRLVALIQERLETGDERLFETTPAKVRSYLKKIDGDFKPHDFRTWNATAGARDIIRSLDMPTTAEEFKSAQSAVAQAMARRLGDEPATVLEHYIDPHVWQEWEHATR